MQRGLSMEEREELKKLYQIARMYYEQDMTQSQIAKELGIYRTTISRMLKKIREKEIVQIRINYEAFHDIAVSEQLKERFGLKEVLLVPDKENQTKDQKRRAMGQACAKFLDRIVQAGDVVGFSWGTSLAAVAEELEPEKPQEEVICVPLIGGPDGKLASRYHANTIVYEAARKWKGDSTLIDVPAIAGNEELKSALAASGHFQEVKALWDRLTIAVVGIGSPAINQGDNWKAFYGGTLSAEMEEGEVAGDICSNFYDKRGRMMDTELLHRTISIDLQALHKTRYSIGVAESNEKVEAIKAALTAGHLNVLVTTEETAKALIREGE
ncbi:UNVERIFIED_CONTAM: sugar-binding transcriptional regulator [Halobacillus marinus]|uniref:sugar-binding transcriptional regulator n=2 Tax=Bacillaceae TaxID=186817 RepID=UPI002406164B|nr:sugar-binding transcriptional regulator [Halobacillus sp. BAB-2008]